MALNPIFILLALFACAVLVSAADLYKVLDCAYQHLVLPMETECLTLACLLEQWTSLHRNTT